MSRPSSSSDALVALEALSHLDRAEKSLKVVRTALQLCSDARRAESVNPVGTGPAADLNKIVALARQELTFRRQRDKTSACAHLFGEPSWELLLDLFVQHAEDRSVSVTSACLASGVPTTTALRYIASLEKAGLVARHPSSSDKRVIQIGLTQSAVAWMTDTLRQR